MGDSVWIAIVAAVVAIAASTISPIVLAHMAARTRRQERLEDYARQDQVASRLLAANSLTAKQSAIADSATQIQLREIHTLVNSNMTTVMKAELDARIGQLETMRKLVELNRRQGVLPTIEENVTIETLQDKIDELKVTLRDRTQ